MGPDALFSLANSVALASWSALLLLPRRAVIPALRWGPVLGLSMLYAVLVCVWFFRAEGGGFFDLSAVQALFLSPWVALAGWVHYLAFDLLVGTWIAERADARGLSRVVQAPILLAIFMFGPLGLFLGLAVTLPGSLPSAERVPA